MNTSSLAGHAIELLDKIAKSNLPADKVVFDFYRERRYLGSHDRRWITEKVYSVVRNFILLKELAKSCASNPRLLEVFLIHEIHFAEMRPEQIENDYSKLLETYRLTGNGVDLEKLSACASEKLKEIESASQNPFLLNSFPDFFGELLPESVRKDVIPIMIALNHEARVCIRVDTARISRDEVVEFFKSQGIEAVPTEFSPVGVYLSKRVSLNNIQLYKNGLIEIQEEASQIVGLIVDPKPDEVIVDACAGAGGKSLELAALSNGSAKIFALDVDESRLKNLSARADRGGYKNIFPVKVMHDTLVGIEQLAGNADKVIVDAPCTGSGTIRRNPDKKFRLTRSLVEKQASYQKNLLSNYAQLVKTGGFVFYVTCSIFTEENRRVVDWFLNSDGRYQRVDVSNFLAGQKFSGLIEDGFLAIYPYRHEMDGFFAAVMKRVS
ncbi:MAG: RsmB/NOP family class I SAM-dependent RNA methyltransferase [Bacteroidetes bacterium]|nr:RsmB/NOP family class I SAM-dependent RNA methyltransferase [Bacteroidota bacterium]MCL5738382.1 RsmB/NOP family class I SAM-dependent RNA methyltransferase [Bacteroidota bacterium]